MSHVFRVWEKKERERGNRREKIRSFSLPFSLSLSFVSTERTTFVSRETRHNKKRHDATLCLQHKARVLPARKLSRRNPPRRRRDGTSSSTQSGFRRANPGVSRLCTFLRFKLVSLSLSDGMMMVRISSRPEKKRARARLFSPRFVAVAYASGRVG